MGENGESKATNVETDPQVLRPQQVTRSTWEIHRGSSGVPSARHRRRRQNIAEAEAGGGSASAATAKCYAIIRAYQALALPGSAAHNRLTRRSARRSSSCSAIHNEPVAHAQNLGQAAVLPRPHVAFKVVLHVPLGAILVLRASLRSWSCKPEPVRLYVRQNDRLACGVDHLFGFCRGLAQAPNVHTSSSLELAMQQGIGNRQ